MFYMRLFKNEYKEKNDNKPSYSNTNFTVKERESLNIKVDEKRVATPQPSLNVEDDDIPY